MVLISGVVGYFWFGLYVLTSGILWYSKKFVCWCNDGNRLVPVSCVALKLNCDRG